MLSVPCIERACGAYRSVSGVLFVIQIPPGSSILQQITGFHFLKMADQSSIVYLHIFYLFRLEALTLFIVNSVVGTGVQMSLQDTDFIPCGQTCSSQIAVHFH